MERKPVYGDRWSETCLERSERLGQLVYRKALSRKVTWPVKQRFPPQPEEAVVNISLDEAFQSMVDSLHQISRVCHKYHANREMVKGFENSVEHCQSYHRRPRPAPPCRHGNPFKREENVHLTLPEGAYAVTAHNVSTGIRKTNIVQVAADGALTLDFHV